MGIATITLLSLSLLAANWHCRASQEPSRPVSVRIENTVSHQDGELINAIDLIEAIKQGDGAKVNQLLDSGISPDSTSIDGDAALFWAIRLNRVDMIHSLLRSGADINKRAHDVGTLLQTAAATGRIETTRLILNLGVDVNTKDAGGHTALMFALMSAMVKNASSDTLSWIQEPEDHSPQMLGDGHRGIAELLVNAGADVNTQAEDCGLTALMIAAMSGNVQLTTLLLAAGADTNLNAGEKTALGFALAFDSPEKLERELNDNFAPQETEARSSFIRWVYLTEPERSQIATLLRNR